MSAATSLTWGGCSVPGDRGVPAVAVSLTGPTAARARVQARRAIGAGADVLELRVDLLEEADALVAFAEAAGEELPAPDPMVVATAAAQVLECLRRMTDVVASFHDFEATPVDDVLEEVLVRMADEGADLAKIAVWPTGAADVARLLGVCARAAADPEEGTGLGVPVAAMSMGALGVVSRVAPAFGSALTFAVVPDEQGETQASAPGQLPIQDVRRCLELLQV